MNTKINNLNEKSKKRLFFILVALIIIIGIAIIVIKGLNFDLRYQSSQKIELYIGKDCEVSDIKNITDEVMPNTDVIIQKVESFNDTVDITASKISDEQKQNIISKVNEKYGTELKAENIDTLNIPNYKGRDIAKQYISSIIISIVIILAYITIRFYKLGIRKVLVNTILTLAIVEAMFVSILAITRIPVCEYTMPAAITIYILTILIITFNYEKQLKVKIENQK